MSTKLFNRLTKRQITTILATVAVIAIVITLGVSYYARSQAHAQALQACTQASEALQVVKADAQTALSAMEANEATNDATTLEGLLGQDFECDPQASTKTLKAQAVKITQQADTIKAATKTLSQAQMTAAKETLTQATGSLKRALEQAKEVLKISEGKINDDNARAALAKLVDQAKQAISAGSPSELKAIREAASNLKQLLTELSGQTAAVSADHDNYLKTQAEAARAQADSPTSDTGNTEYYPDNNPGYSNDGNYYTAPSNPGNTGNTGDTGNNGGWVESYEPGPDECWLGDTSGNPAVPVPCDP